MTEWKRWRDDPEAPAELRALFAGGDGPRGMTAEERARARARATAMVGAGATGFVLVSAWARALASGKVIGIAAVVTVATATTMMITSQPHAAPSVRAIVPAGDTRALADAAALRARTRPTPPPRIEESARAATTASDAVVPSRPPQEGAPTAPTTVATNAAAIHSRRDAHQLHPVVPHTSPSESSSDVDPLVRETEIVDEAMRSVTSNPAHALQLADRHAREFPHGQLVAERAYVRVRALARLGRTDEATSEARALIEAHPQSEYAARLSRVLESGGGLR